jgi:hypothetical protein
MATSNAQTDYSNLALPTAYLPGILGEGAGVVPGLGFTTRGVVDFGLIALGVGLCITGFVMLISGSKGAKEVVGTAVGAVTKGLV